MGVRKPHETEKSLDMSILAAAAMECVEDDVRRHPGQDRRQIGTWVDLLDRVSCFPEGARAFAARGEQDVALGRCATHQEGYACLGQRGNVPACFICDEELGLFEQG